MNAYVAAWAPRGIPEFLKGWGIREEQALRSHMILSIPMVLLVATPL